MEHSQLLKVEEVASRLGLSRSFVYRLIAEGNLPAIRLGKVIRVKVSELETWIGERTGNGLEVNDGRA